ncbi:hypothetical protein [Dyadobacter sp. CY312]|uniref:hypothetical protein n=1 Tax=Dyadobacter sp. CY312 TaxID=2907303 RepID=UPI001F162789|nr:hypothetical protein [Dyadobacter sp. CY312]MCE7043504.1 hypothetical protein [Dyadobacter sp. CY312]
MIETAHSYKTKFPIFQWLFLAFLSAGLANGTFQFQSVRPVPTVENVISNRSNFTKTAGTIRYSSFTKSPYIPQTIRLQTIRLDSLSQKLEVSSTISFQLYPTTNHFQSCNKSVFTARCTTTSPDEDLIHS